MQDTDRKAFYQTWAAAWELCGKSVTDRMLQLAFESLKEYRLGDIQSGVMAHTRDPESGQFPPKPADVIRKIDGTSEDRALDSWGMVYQGICGNLHAGSVVFDDPVVHMVVNEMGGLSRMGRETKPGDVRFLQNEFIRLYKLRSRRPTDYPPALHTGKDLETVSFLGNEEQCAVVYGSAQAKRLTAA